MTSGELQDLEKALQIRLPAQYKSAVVAFPVPALAGNDDTYFWDNAEALLRLNLELRKPDAFGLKAWPAHLFAISAGRDEADLRVNNITAIDLRDERTPVWGFGAGIYAHVPPTKLESEFGAFVSKYAQFAPQLLKGRRSSKTAGKPAGDSTIGFDLIGGAILLGAGILLWWLYLSDFPIEPRESRWALPVLGVLAGVPGVFFLFSAVWIFFTGKERPFWALFGMITVMLCCFAVLLSWIALQAWSGSPQAASRFSGGLTGTIYEYRLVWTLVAVGMDALALVFLLIAIFGTAGKLLGRGSKTG